MSSQILLTPVRAVLRAAAPGIGPDAILVSVTKGLEPDSLRFPSEVAAETLPGIREAVEAGDAARAAAQAAALAEAIRRAADRLRAPAP